MFAQSPEREIAPALLGTFSTPVVADASCPVRGPPELLVTKGGSPGRMEETGHPAYE